MYQLFNKYTYCKSPFFCMQEKLMDFVENVLSQKFPEWNFPHLLLYKMAWKMASETWRPSLSNCNELSKYYTFTWCMAPAVLPVTRLAISTVTNEEVTKLSFCSYFWKDLGKNIALPTGLTLSWWRHAAYK